MEEICYVCNMNLQEYVSCRKQDEGGAQKREALVGWRYLDPGWFSFNTDGSRWNNGNATGGGVLRDENGSWIKGFAHNLGVSSIMTVEIYAIWDAICIARRLHITNLYQGDDIQRRLELPHSPCLPRSKFFC